MIDGHSFVCTISYNGNFSSFLVICVAFVSSVKKKIGDAWFNRGFCHPRCTVVHGVFVCPVGEMCQFNGGDGHFVLHWVLTRILVRCCGFDEVLLSAFWHGGGFLVGSPKGFFYPTSYTCHCVFQYEKPIGNCSPFMVFFCGFWCI